MAKTTVKAKEKSAPRSRWWLHLLGVAVFVGAIAVAAWFARDYVDTKVDRQTKPPLVVLKNRPVWMSDVLAQQIIAAVAPHKPRSAFDHELLVETADKLAASPWVSQVNAVRRGFTKHAGDTLEIDAVYRTPEALVKWDNAYCLIDGRGVKLPEQYLGDQVERIVRGNDGRVNIRVIEGVADAPPGPGKSWRGSDVRAGLQMAKLLFDQPFAQDIYKINVENYEHRRSANDAQIVLKTRYGTEVRWGRPPDASDFFIEVPAEQKLASLGQIYQQYGRVDANQPWLDVRFDKITYPSPTAGPQASTHD